MRLHEITDGMLDNTIRTRLENSFSIDGTYEIVNRAVNVVGHIRNKAGKFPYFPVRFGKVDGEFTCHSAGLVSLKNAPHTVTGDFSVWNNDLTTLEHGPTTANFYDCDKNKLITLLGAPVSITGSFQCNDNQLTSFEGCPEALDIECTNNLITSSKGLVRPRQSLHVTLNPELPLLAFLSIDHVTVHDPDGGVNDDIGNILIKYRNADRKQAIECAKELRAMGLASNAKF